MSLAQTFLAEFDSEMTATRRLLACVPEDKTSFRPHPKSWTLGSLALHIANIPTWTRLTLDQSELDLNPPGGPAFKPPVFESAAATVKLFDTNVAGARAAITGKSDADVAAPWTLKNGGRVMFTQPKAGVLRSFIMNHLIHHRGQLTVYLRLCDVPLPSTYGPTADVGI